MATSCNACSRSKKPRSRNVVKAHEILIDDFTDQCLIIKGLLHGLQDAMLKRVKFSLFLELINFHLENETIPPGLQIHVKPPGFEENDKSSIWERWNSQLYCCSMSFVKILKHFYKEEVKTNTWLKQSLEKQCIDAITIHRRCTRLAAKEYVQCWIDKVVRQNITCFTKLFYQQNYSPDYPVTIRAPDHQKWIEEQSQFIEKLSEIEKDRHYAMQQSGSRPSSSRSSARKMIDLEEEELKYLKFVNEVTEDILSTGVYSDSVLHQLMERHVDRKKSELSVRKMWEMLDKLKIDLGMSDKRYRNSADRKPIQVPLHSSYNEDQMEEPRALPRKTALEKHVHIRPDPEDIQLDATTSTFATLTSADVTRDDDYKEIKKEFSTEETYIKEPLEFHTKGFKGVPKSHIPSKDEEITRDEDARISSVTSYGSSQWRAENGSGRNIVEAAPRKIRDRSDDVQIKSNSLTSFKSRISTGEGVDDLRWGSNDVFRDEISENSALNFENREEVFSPAALEKSSSKRSLFSMRSDIGSTLQRNSAEQEKNLSIPVPKRRSCTAESKLIEEFKISVQPASSSVIDVKAESIKTNESDSSLKQRAVRSSVVSADDRLSSHNVSQRQDDVEICDHMISCHGLETRGYGINSDHVTVDNQMVSQTSLSDGRRNGKEKEEGEFSTIRDEIRDAALKASGSDRGSEAGTEATYDSVPALSMTLKPPKSPEQSELGSTGAWQSTNGYSDVVEEDKPAASSLSNAQEDIVKYSDDFESDDDAF